MTNPEKSKGTIRFRLPFNRPFNRLRRKPMKASSAKPKSHQDLPEIICSRHSDDHRSDASGHGERKMHHKLPIPMKNDNPLNQLNHHLLSLHSSDVQLRVFSFLDLSSLRSMMATNRDFRSLLVSDSAYQVWRPICRAKFFPTREEHYDSEHGMFLHDELSLPIAVSPNNAFCRYNRVNLPLLLSMTPDHVPTGMMDEVDSTDVPNIVDDDGDGISNHPPLIHVLADDEDSSSTTTRSEHGDHSEDTSFRSSVTSSSKPAPNTLDIRLHFNGNVGSGQVYSVKANHPLPKPTLQVVSSDTRIKPSMMILRKRSRRSYTVAWNPMVVPYNSLADPPRLVHVTPRLVSYFEISIEAAPPTEERRRPIMSIMEEEPPRAQDCVAIGLATQDYEPRDTLPGWDACSFGYHSDNGGLYHGSGSRRQRTESFGPGDTVGMGVDYVAKTIFVTKNGRFLGYAYDVFTMKFLATKDLYPVVGMDSKDTVHVNYGGMDHPFHFNLASYCHRQQQTMVPAKSRISTKFQFTNDSNCVEIGCLQSFMM